MPRSTSTDSKTLTLAHRTLRSFGKSSGKEHNSLPPTLLPTLSSVLTSI